MAVAFATSNTAVFQDWNGAAESRTITKPSGLAAGDLLLCIMAGDGISPASWDTPAGWTKLVVEGVPSGTSTVSYSIVAFAKVADSGDAAATNFTFTANGAINGVNGTEGAGALMRFTGSYLPDIYTSAQDTDGGTTNNYSGGVSPTVANQILVMGVFGHKTNATTTSAYAVTTTDPTWTELFDTNYNNGTDDATFAVAYGSRAPITSTGNWSAAFAATVAESSSVLLAIQSTQNASISPSVISAVATVQEPTVSGGAIVSPSVQSVVATVQTPTVSAGTSKWNNVDKNSSTFANPDKS